MYESGTAVSITDTVCHDNLPDIFPYQYYEERRLGASGEVMCGFETRFGEAYLIKINNTPTFVYASEIECYAEVSFKDKKSGLGDWLKV